MTKKRKGSKINFCNSENKTQKTKMVEQIVKATNRLE